MPAPPTTGQTLARGSAWIALGQGISAVSGLATTIVAARMLAPEDFGLMGIALLTISTLTALSRTGFDRALVQKTHGEELMGVAFSVQILRGLALGLLIFALGYPVAQLYEQPVLFAIFAAMSIGPLTGGFRNIATVAFQRELNFRTIVFFGALQSIFKAGIVLVLLITLRNVWALVIGHIAGSVFDAVVSYVVQPRRARPEWNKEKFRELAKFGKWLTGLSILSLIVTKGDDIFVSKYLGVTALGLYAFAYELANIPATHVTHVVGRVSFPTYCRLNDNPDKTELRRAFFNVMRATILITAPLSALLYLNAESIVAHVVGEQWRPIIPLIHILVIAGFVRSVAALAAALFQAAGRPHLDFIMNMPRFLILVGLIWPACAYAGLEGASWLTLVAVSSTLPTWFYGLNKIAGVTFKDLFRENLLGMATTLVLVLCCLVSERLVAPTNLELFVGQIIVALGLFGGAMWILGRATPLDLYSEITTLSRALKRKPA